MSEDPPIYRVSRQPQAIAACVKGPRPASALRSVAPQGMPSFECEAALQFVESAREEILRRFDEGGIAFETNGAGRVVQLWGCIEFEVAANGTRFNARLLEPLPLARPLQVKLDLSQPIGRFTWTPLFGAVLAAFEMRAGIDFPRRTFEGGTAMLESFNWVATHERELSRIAIERPALLPFLQLVAGHASGSPLRRFEEAVHRAGITSSARRKLERWGFAAFSEATFCETASHPVTIVAHYANLLDRLRIADAPPSMFTNLVVGGVGFHAPDWYLRALLKEVLTLGEDNPYLPEFEDTMAWLATRPRAPDPSQQRADWRWIATQSRRHRVACDKNADTPWTTPSGEYVDGDYRVVPIRSLRELLEEAEAMRNCLGTRAEDCANGFIVVFSIRDRRSGKRLACFSVTWVPKAGFWQLLQIAGKSNAEASAELTDLALRVRARLAKPGLDPGA